METNIHIIIVSKKKLAITTKTTAIKTKTTMKRYSCEMNDGEYLCSFHQLKDAKKYRSENNFNFISRWIRIYDNKKNIYII